MPPARPGPACAPCPPPGVRFTTATLLNMSPRHKTGGPTFRPPAGAPAGTWKTTPYTRRAGRPETRKTTPYTRRAGRPVSGNRNSQPPSSAPSSAPSSTPSSTPLSGPAPRTVRHRFAAAPQPPRTTRPGGRNRKHRKQPHAPEGNIPERPHRTARSAHIRRTHASAAPHIRQNRTGADRTRVQARPISTARPVPRSRNQTNTKKNKMRTNGVFSSR